MTDNDPVEKTESQLQVLSSAMTTGTMQHARRMLNELVPAEIADLLESLPYTERNLLWDLVDLRPASPEDMLRVSGIGPAKLEQYGEVFLEALRD